MVASGRALHRRHICPPRRGRAAPRVRHAGRHARRGAARVRRDRLRDRPPPVDAHRAPLRAERARQLPHRDRHVRVVGLPLGVHRPLRAGLSPHDRRAQEAPGKSARGDPQAPPVLRRDLRRQHPLQRPHEADSAWIVRLIDDTGNETAPEEIVAIRKPNVIERVYFPYNTVYRRAFRIHFPRLTADGRPTISSKAKWFGIRFAGAQGNTQLIWQLDESAESAPSEIPKDTPVRSPTDGAKTASPTTSEPRPPVAAP